MVSYLKIYFLQGRLLALIKDAASSITLEAVIEKHKVPSTHAYSSKNVVDKTITLGKLEGSVEVHVPSHFMCFYCCKWLSSVVLLLLLLLWSLLLLFFK